MLARNAICGWLHLLILTPAVLAETSPAKYQVKIDRLYKIGGTVAIQSSAASCGRECARISVP